MALPVPSDPKVYTTKYANWRGVDYTNDPSNVWYRRSPQGVNMLPNLDGQPYKRNGWKIEFTPADFREAAGIVDDTVEVEQYKVDYFELGGAEFLFFYTSIGCFYYADELTYIDKSWEVADPDEFRVNERPYYYRQTAVYKQGDLVWHTDNGVDNYYRCNADYTTPKPFSTSDWTLISRSDLHKPFPPTDPDTGEPANIDYSKSFFFEGAGRAAYYLFANDKMYWFDGEKLHEVHPDRPVVLTMCDENGVGTVLDSVNLLTEWRGVEYTCAGGSQYIFTVPNGFQTTTINGTEYSTGIWNVYLKDATDGSWKVAYNWYRDSTNRGRIRFYDQSQGTSTPWYPPETFVGQTNMLIVYTPEGGTVSETLTSPSASQKMKITKTTVTKQKQTYNKTTKKWVNSGSPTTTNTYKNTTSPTFSLASPKKPLGTYVKRYVKSGSGTWNESTQKISRKFNAYGNKVTLYGTNNGKALYDDMTSIKASTTTTTKYITSSKTVRYKQTTTTAVKTFEVRIRYTQWNYVVSSAEQLGVSRDAFFAASKSLVFGNGIINQAFLTASTKKKYTNRVWYSAATNPYYFPDTNYIEVGATDKNVMGLIKVGEYLGVIKEGSATDTSIYLAYPTSFENITTYAVKQSVNGIGAVSNGAFNILNDEPLFLSSEGVMGIEPSENEERKIRNRSYYINKKLLAEPSLESAVSFVYKGMYWLCVNSHCYVLDGSQKSSWENSKTNLQYECYYLENIPAKCFAKKDGQLWFVDANGNVCRFRDDTDELRYVDAYDVEALGDEVSVVYKANTTPTQREDGSLYYGIASLTEVKQWNVGLFSDDEEYEEDIYLNGLVLPLRDGGVDGELLYIDYVEHHVEIEGEPEPREYILEGNTEYVVTGGALENAQVEIPAGVETFNLSASERHNLQNFAVIAWFYYIDQDYAVLDVSVGSVIQYNKTFYSVTQVETNASGGVIGFVVSVGVPIKAVWGTIADDDGSAHYYKKLQKKGSLVALMPMSDSGVKAWIVKDEEDPIFVGETDAENHILPFNYYLKKKVKKYKRLQIIAENDSYNDGFGVDEIIKCYTVGNYAKK